MAVNYLVRGIQFLKTGVFTGIPVYLIIVAALYVLNIRRSISRNCLWEMMLCIYGVTLLGITGVFELNYSFDGMFHYNLIPFIDSSIVPVLLNFFLFIPYGFLLPLVFPSCQWNGKKAAMVGCATSLLIELLQMAGGRYGEIDDVLMNTLGTFSGWFIYSCIDARKKDGKRAMKSLAVFSLALLLGFVGIYVIGENDRELPDGLEAVESDIAEVNVYCNGEKRTVAADTEVYHCFENQLSNCGGHVLEAETISADKIWNGDCLIEVRYASPQSIRFENAEDFSIENADRLLYNADQNILYWGNSGYQNCLDYTEMGEELLAHQEEILKQYEQLAELIVGCFSET